MKHIIEVSRSDTDHIIISDLRNKHNLTNDSDLKSAIEVILKHYMSTIGYDEWIRSIK